MRELVYGFDFGTSNTSVALTIDNKTKALPIEMGNRTSLPSLLYIPSKGRDYYVGRQAALRYVEENMTGRFMQSLKSLLVSETFSGTHTRLGFKSTEDLIAMVLTKVREKANGLVGYDVTNVMLGRPVVFSPDHKIDQLAQERLVKAALQSGFKEVNLQLEPIAAAMHYEVTLKKEELVLVADLGGGTTDFTLIRLSPDRSKSAERMSDVLGSGGVYIGGDSFDSAIMTNKLLSHFGQDVKYKSWDKWMKMPSYLMREITRWENIAFIKDRRTERLLREISAHSDDSQAVERLVALIDNNLGYSIFQSIERAKCGVSNVHQDAIYFAHDSMRIVEQLTREEFESFIAYALEEFRVCVEEVMRSAGVSKGDVDTVFLTGGSSAIPCVKDLFASQFSDSKLRSSDNFTSVASGLALIASR